MSSESRKAKSQDLCARIDDVLTGHEHQRMYREIPERPDEIWLPPGVNPNEVEWTVHSVTGSAPDRVFEPAAYRAWERFCRALTSHWRDS